MMETTDYKGNSGTRQYRQDRSRVDSTRSPGDLAPISSGFVGCGGCVGSKIQCLRSSRGVTFIPQVSWSLSRTRRHRTPHDTGTTQFCPSRIPSICGFRIYLVMNFLNVHGKYPYTRGYTVSVYNVYLRIEGIPYP